MTNEKSKWIDLSSALQFMQQKEALLIGAFMAIVSQLWHAIDAYVIISNKGQAMNWNDPYQYFVLLLGLFFAISVSFGILIMTVRGRVKLAYFFLAVEVFINVIHFQVNGGMNWGLLMSTLILCIIGPVVITAYSHEVNEGSISKDGFIDYVKHLSGKDITKPNVDFDPVVKEELRKAYKERVSVGEMETKKSISKILNEANNGALFEPENNKQ